MYENKGDPEGTGQATFTRIDSGAIVNDGGNSWGSSWGDYDNDGDLIVANIGINFLYQNNGDPEGMGKISFTRITSGAIANDGGISLGCSWGDYDNDGDLDLFVANSVSEDNFLYRNNGNGSFTRITSGAIVNDGGSSLGCSWGDYDNDGDLDLFVANRENNLLYQNNGTNNNWIKIKCVGTLSSTSAIGAKVKVKATLNGKQVWQLLEISGQTGQSAQNSLEADFGLGDASVVDSIRIAWTSGTVQVLTDVSVNQFLTVTEIPLPQIEHTSTSTVESDRQITVQAAISADNNVAETSLLFRRGGESAFTTVPMSDQGNGLFRGNIPAGEVTARGVEYRIAARDILGNLGRLPAEGFFSVQVHVSDGISSGQARPHGSDQTAYRIFSVPLDLDDNSPASVLEDDMGEYDDTRWRFLEYLGDNNYVEYPDITEIMPGKGYWFLVSEPVRVIDTGAGTSNITSEEYAIALGPGWNLIGNPFNFPIPVANILLQSRVADLRTFTGSWNNTVTDPVPRILPFEGYTVFSEISTTLLINPDLSVSTSSLAKAAESISENEILWSIEIHAQSQQARDVDNVAGVVLSAAENWDQRDLPEPPPIGEYVSIYFPHPEWGKLSKRFCTDFRPEFSQGNTWEFEVKSNIRDRVQLTFAGLETVPSEFEIWLVDETLNLTQNLRDNTRYAVAGSEEHPKSLKLLVGKTEFIGENLASVQTIPSDYELSQNFPNPFNPATTIRYGLPRDEMVTLKIYNLLGKEVATLLNNERKLAGNYAAIWDGRNNQGQVVASGIYIYQLQAGEFSAIKKMVYVR
ncbi:MAG: T9SS type A sorting domain-containing protein [Caldithrix sp.]|nr:MAG: T9SS type A sorting domain-containing protein [Caldithrix sp.]